MPKAKPDVSIVDEQKFIRISRPRVAKIIRAVLAGEKSAARSVTVLFTDDKRIRRYHKDYMGLDSATDVMSFGAGEPGYLGDVVVSGETAWRRAAEFGVTPRNEAERYAVHGVLHLLGYKDKKAVDHKRMHSKQEKYLREFAK